MRRTIVATLAVAILFAGAARAQQPPDPFEGLWRARRWFGPEARGPLVIRREGASYRAEMLGLAIPVRVERGELWFTLPNAAGSFRGQLPTAEGIVGVWR